MNETTEEQDLFSQIQEYFGATKLKPEQYSALALAYIGDGVYDLVIRTIVTDLGGGKVKDFHRMTSEIVKAPSQARIMRLLEPVLDEQEQAIYRHGRNAKSATSAKNASIIDYRIATGFEALVGYLYLSHRMDRLMELIRQGLDAAGLMPEKRTG